LAFRNLGTNLLTQQQYDKAADAYRQALALNPHIFESPTGQQKRRVREDAGRGKLHQGPQLRQGRLTDCALAYLERAFHEGSATVRA